MNNWRLLLFALVAVFEPIFSFTDNNLVDGRQQCCDLQRDTLFRDSRPYLYENNRLAKTVSPLRRLNTRDEIRADRQFSQGVSEVPRRFTERSPRDDPERNIRQNPSIISRFSREVTRRVTSDDNRERQLVGVRRERNTLTRFSDMQRIVRTNHVGARYSESRDENRVHRLSNVRQIRGTFRQDHVDIRSGNSRRQTLTRPTPENLQMREDVDRVGVSYDRRRLGIRERVNVARREQSSRDDVRRYMNNNEDRRERENSPTQRRSLSENSGMLERLRDMQIRVHSRNQRESSQERLSENLQLKNDRRQFREAIRENAKVRVSGDREERRETRESRLMDDRSVRDQRRDSRRESRQFERMYKETRDDGFARERRFESRLVRKSTERDNRINEQRIRSRDLESSRNSRVDSNSNRYDSVRDSNATRRQTSQRIALTNRGRSVADDRFRNVDSARARDNSIMTSKVEIQSEVIGNWQYVLYSVQAAYLCALMMQMLIPNCNEKIQMRNQRWWPLLPQRSIKVD